MFISRRTFNIDGNFTHHRYSFDCHIGSGVLLHLLDTALIYDTSRFDRYISLLYSFDPSLFDRFFSSLPFEWSCLNVKVFDTYISCFENYLKQLSDLLCRQWGIDSSLLSGNQDVLLVLLNCISFSLKTPIKIFDENNEVDFDDLSQYENMCPIFLSFRESTIFYFYPSLTHYQFLRNQRNEQPQTECFRCSNKKVEEEVEDCEKGCKICLECWEENLKNLRQYRCPCCGWVQGQEISSRLGQQLDLSFLESRESRESRESKESKEEKKEEKKEERKEEEKKRTVYECKKCRRTIGLEYKSFCSNCVICFKCFRDSNTLAYKRCPGCFQRLSEEKLVQLTQHLQISHQFPAAAKDVRIWMPKNSPDNYKNPAKHGTERIVTIPNNFANFPNPISNFPKIIAHIPNIPNVIGNSSKKIIRKKPSKKKNGLPNIPTPAPQKIGNQCCKCREFKDIGHLFLICRNCPKILCNKCIKLKEFLKGKCDCDTLYKFQIYEHEGKKSIPDCCNEDQSRNRGRFSGILKICKVGTDIIHEEHKECPKCTS